MANQTNRFLLRIHILLFIILGFHFLPAWQQQLPAPVQYPAPAAYYPPYRERPRTLWDPFVYGECIGSFIAEESCTGEILSSFWTGRVYLAPGCCDAVRQVTDECIPTAFALLANPYFGYALKGYCETRPWIHSLP
ncbi:Egg cell-secreted protein 1.1 [Linum grandiflorum]